MKEVLKSPSVNESYIVHLVCTQKTSETLRRRPVKGNNNDSSNINNNNHNNLESNASDRTSHETIAPNVSSSLLSDSTTTGLGTNYLISFPASHPVTTSLNSETINTMPMLLQPGFINSEQLVQQMAIFEQMYAQYMAQYLNQPVFMTPTATTTATTTTNLVNSSNATHAENQPQEQAPVQPQAQRHQPQRVGQQEDDEDVRNRDWLDWIYWFIRASIFFSIIYFYSTLSRFIIVIGLAILVHLYKLGMLNFNNQVNGNQEVAAARRAPNEVDRAPDANNPNDERNIQANSESTNEATNENVDASFVNSVQTNFSKLKMLWILVSALFTSLIPDHPPPINVN